MGWTQLGTMTRSGDVANASGLDKKSLGRIKAYAIKRWFDEMERIWVNNWRKLKYMFDPELMSTRNEGWNEINLVDIKVVECYIIKDVTPLPDGVPPLPPGFDDEDPDTAGVPISGYIEIAPRGDLGSMMQYTADGLRTVREIESKIRT